MAKPQHVMSLFLCSDQLLLNLLPPERIASVSFFARSYAGPTLAAQAARVKENYGTAEEVLAEKPDLILAGTYTTTATRAVVKRVGLPMVEVPAANNFAQIRNVTRLVGHAVGEDAKAESMIADMDATLKALATSAPRRRIVVAGWDGSGMVPGKGSLFDAILTAAGAVNVAATSPELTSGAFDIEQLLSARPDILLYGDATVDRPGLRNAQLQHPAIRKLYGQRQWAYPSVLYACGVPQSADAAKHLRDAMLNLMQTGKPGS